MCLSREEGDPLGLFGPVSMRESVVVEPRAEDFGEPLVGGFVLGLALGLADVVRVVDDLEVSAFARPDAADTRREAEAGLVVLELDAPILVAQQLEPVAVVCQNSAELKRQ